MSSLTQRRQWYQAAYALYELVQDDRRARPPKQANTQPESTDTFVRSAVWYFVLMNVGSRFCPYVLYPFYFMAMICMFVRWLIRTSGLCTDPAVGVCETLDTLASVINSERARRGDPLQSCPSPAPVPNEEQDDEPTAEEQPALPDPVRHAIDVQWQRLSDCLESADGRQHVIMPRGLVDEHEPLFQVNSDKLEARGYTCIVDHCYGDNCLVLLTSERREKLQQRPQEHTGCNLF